LLSADDLLRGRGRAADRARAGSAGSISKCGDDGALCGRNRSSSRTGTERPGTSMQAITRAFGDFGQAWMDLTARGPGPARGSKCQGDDLRAALQVRGGASFNFLAEEGTFRRAALQPETAVLTGVQQQCGLGACRAESTMEPSQQDPPSALADAAVAEDDRSKQGALPQPACADDATTSVVDPPVSDVVDKTVEVRGGTSDDDADEESGAHLTGNTAAAPGRVKRDAWIFERPQSQLEDARDVRGLRTSNGFAGKQSDLLKSRRSKSEAEAALQRLVAGGCQDYDEIRNMRKLLNEL